MIEVVAAGTTVLLAQEAAQQICAKRGTSLLREERRGEGVVGMCVHRLQWANVLSDHRYYCPEGSQNEAGFNGTSDHPCRTGHYCPSGTAGPTEHPCPAGTFNNQTRASSNSSCQDCAPGSASSNGASYCSVCDPGKYEHDAKCKPCKKGHWCKDGHYQRCPVNTYDLMTYECMHDCIEGAVGTGTQRVHEMNLNVQNASKVCYPRKVPHKLATVHRAHSPTLPLQSHMYMLQANYLPFLYAHASCLYPSTASSTTVLVFTGTPKIRVFDGSTRGIAIGKFSVDNLKIGSITMVYSELSFYVHTCAYTRLSS